MRCVFSGMKPPPECQTPRGNGENFNCIAALAKELFGKRFLEKTETCKRRKGVKKMYNYKTAKTNTAILAILNIAMKI